MTFTDRFDKLSFPNLGLVRFPKVVFTDDQRRTLGVKATASNRDILKKLAWDGYLARESKGEFSGISRDQVIAQFKTEFETFDKTAVHDYLLIVWDINRWCDTQGIVRGRARGSAAGSLTLFCLGVVGINPIKHNLNFPRFISEARMKPVIKDGVVYVDGKSAPDIDTDYQYLRRVEVLRYIETKYAGHTCKISTRLELTGKMALKDALKTFAGYHDEDAKRVSDFVTSSFGKVQTLHEAKENQTIKDWLAEDEYHQRVYAIAMAIEGAPVAKGQHPSGVFISFDPLDGNIPVELSKTKDVVTSFDMETVAGLGIKLDELGIRTLDLVAETAKLGGEVLDDIDVNDPLIYRYLAESSNYRGLFQIEDGLTKEATRKIGPRNVDELASVLAISRPGALQYISQFADYIKTGKVVPFYPAIDKILEPTGGALIMQEQITEICRDVFGLSGIDADSIRYAVGKKKREDMAKWEPVLYKNGRERGIPEDVIKGFWDTCNASADYSFCKCLSPDTTVETPTGRRPLSEIEAGDKVLAYDYSIDSDHYVTVKAVHRSEAVLWNVVFSTGHRLTCSMHHRLLCEDGQMRPLGECLMSGNTTICVRGEMALGWIVSLTERGPQDSLDLEVAHPDHNFYAGGVVVSNSHAVAYAYLTATTVYLKSKYPRQFYLVMLKLASEEPNAMEYMNEVFKEMKIVGLHVFPPDLIKSDSDFTLEDDGVRFGLKHVKGINENTMVKLTSFKRDFTSKFDVFKAASAAKVNIGTLSHLISAGCLNIGNQSRAHLVFEAQLYNELTDKEKGLVDKLAPEFNDDLVAIITSLKTRNDDKGKPLIKESRLATLQRDYLPYWLMYQQNCKNAELCDYIHERHLLGFSYTGTLHGIYAKRVVGLRDITAVIASPPPPPREKGKPNPEPLKFVAFVEEVKKHVSQKDKTPYLKMTVYDDGGSVKVMLYGEERVEACRQFNGDIPRDGAIVIITGNKTRDGTMIFADSIIEQVNPIAVKRSQVAEKT